LQSLEYVSNLALKLMLTWNLCAHNVGQDQHDLLLQDGRGRQMSEVMAKMKVLMLTVSCVAAVVEIWL